MSVVITRGQAQLGRKSSLTETDPSKAKALAEAESERVEIDGRKSFYKLRAKWSWIIILWISGLLWFNSYLAYKIGTLQWHFIDYEWFITAVTVETFLQVVGLGYVAAKFLFSRG